MTSRIWRCSWLRTGRKNARRRTSSWMEGGVEGTMRTIKGPGIFLAQFAGDAAPFNSLKSITAWAAKLGYKGVQIPCWDARLFDLKRAAESKTYCDEIRGTVAGPGPAATAHSSHLRGE